MALWRTLGVLAMAALSGGACRGSAEEAGDASEAHWDSEDGNPTHATHSYMAEYAIASMTGAFPEVAQYRAAIVKGANMELHELPIKDAYYDAVRIEIGGNNWAADRPEKLWDKAVTAYRAGNKEQAYTYVGIILHYVQDMGVPAHAFHVIHQSSFGKWDNIEVLAFFDFHADMKTLAPSDPGFESPLGYIEWSGEDARNHWNTAFPGQKYTRTSIPQAYKDLSDDQWTFLRTREAHATMANLFALRRAATLLAKPR